MDIILTGDRPTGPLHLGHYVGSLKNRIELQNKANVFIIVADTQALTDYFEESLMVRENIFQVTQDYLACGIDPNLSCIFIQSQIRALPELTMYYMNLVTIARLERNPTVKAEIHQKEMQEVLPCGFFCYPISQAADITAFKATCIPVGIDQLPMIEQTNEIVRKFNRIYQKEVLLEVKPMLGTCSKLVGIDGKAKASKSLSNCIFLNDSAEKITQKVMQMYTDPNHIKISDPGQIEGNVVFAYLDAFDSNQNELQDLKTHYKKGGLGDITIKKRLISILEEFFLPIRERRSKISQDFVYDVLKAGSKKANEIADTTLFEVKSAMNLIFEKI